MNDISKIKTAIKNGICTTSLISRRIKKSTNHTRRILADMVADGMITAKKIQTSIIYSLNAEFRYHDPFGMCITKNRSGNFTSERRIHRISEPSED